MRLVINGQATDFMPIQVFRKIHGLPLSFRMAAFETKFGQDFGSIDQAQDALHQVQANILVSLPSRPPYNGWSALILELQILFRSQLYTVNTQINLKPSEIDYAVNGLGEVLNLLLRLAFQAAMRGHPPPDANTIYRQWLNDTIQISSMSVPFRHGNELWHIQTIYHAYGRVGLKVNTGTGCFYVVDKQLACPAEGFMATLLIEMVTQLQHVLSQYGSESS